MPISSSPELNQAPAATTDQLRAECLALVYRLDQLRQRGRSGALAALRRLERVGDDSPPPAAYWDLVAGANVRADYERFWQALLPMMVSCPHAHGAKAGRELRAAGVSPARIERWLRLASADARRELRKLLCRTSQVDWVRLSRLLWTWDAPRGDELRREFARDFFLERPLPAASL